MLLSQMLFPLGWYSPIDLIFFGRLFHIKHHTHRSVNAKVTNQLHVVERVALVLSANAGLKVCTGHSHLIATFHQSLKLAWKVNCLKRIEN